MNKKLFTAIFAIVIICAMLAFAGCTTDDDPGNGTDMGETTDQNSEFTFSQQSDGSYVVTGLSYNYDGSAEIAIPSQYNGEPVTSIGDRAFSDCTGLTSITIPDSVTSIGDRAFYNCNALTTITIPDGVTSIGDRAFYNCNALTSIIVPDGVTSIGDRAFENCYGLTSVTIPDSVTSIGEGAFFRSTMIETATMPTLAIGSIPKDSLKTLTITSGESIAEQAFYNCRNLTNITISDSVTSIGSSAFYGCTGLTSIIIPDSVTIIGDSTFFGCSGLTSITIPDRVTSIGVSAFSGCSSIETATVPALALDYISKSNLITLVITSGESIDYFSLSWCNNLTSLTIPDSVTSIGSYAFNGCSSLTGIIFQGTMQQWNDISKETYWNNNTGSYTVTCTDGVLDKDGQQIS